MGVAIGFALNIMDGTPFLHNRGIPLFLHGCSTEGLKTPKIARKGREGSAGHDHVIEWGETRIDKNKRDIGYFIGKDASISFPLVTDQP